MKYLAEFRKEELIEALKKKTDKYAGPPVNIMEVCGGQTHTILKYALQDLLPRNVSFIHGPGCPVCVTPESTIESAIKLSLKKNVILVSFGDMLRVPSPAGSLLEARANGAEIKIVYSPMEAIKIAADNKQKEIVWFGIGFETTAPMTASLVKKAAELNIPNLSALVSIFLVPPALEFVLNNGSGNIHAFLAAGHVCAITGLMEYEKISAGYKIPIVATGFEPADLLQGVLMCLQQIEKKRYNTENQYSRVIKREGNIAALKLMDDIFEKTDREWRGIGTIPASGLALKEKYSRLDAGLKFNINEKISDNKTMCISGEILTGRKKPPECPEYMKGCTPDHPLGAPMVSAEGACSAYSLYFSGEEADG